MTFHSTTRPIRILGFSLAAGLCALLAAAAPSVPGDKAKADEVLKAFHARFEAIKDYTCTMSSITRGKERFERSLTQYSFKPPGMFHTTVMEGVNLGAVCARGTSGKIRARGGGALASIIMTMPDFDPRLADPRGARIQDADWGTVVGLFMKRPEQGWKIARMPDQPVKGDPCFVIEAVGKPNEAGETREQLCFDKRDVSLRARRLWEGRRKVDETLYYDVKIDQGLADDMFNF